MDHLYHYLTFSDIKLDGKTTRLEGSLTAFSRITDIPVSYFTRSGKFQWSTLPDRRLCNANLEFGKEGAPCTRSLLAAMKTSLSLPDPYIFMCEAGLIHLCYAIVAGGRSCGFLMAGPIAMGNDMDKMIGAFFKKTPAELLDYTCLMSLLRDMRLYTPREIAYLSTLFQDVITSSLEIFSSDDVRYQRTLEQTDISSQLIRLKKEQLTVEYPHESENQLIELIKAGDEDGCSRQFSKYMEDIMVFEGGNLSITKLRLIAFLTQLLKQNDEWQRDYENLYALEKINEAQTLKEMIQTGRTLITGLAQSAARKSYSGSSLIIRELMLYLNAHCGENITLKSAADMIHVNPTYLSTLFRQETGTAFSTYLRNIRLARAEELLATTSMSVTEIALSTGFSSSGYFSKVFRESRGMTPREFRAGTERKNM
ncbi:MAG: helix-turn-helix domain-containing protein [Emergencia sp.]